MLLKLIIMSTRSRIKLGKYGEDLACRYLQGQGYEILTRNFRCHRFGEIDIIAEKKSVISFIEVKTRSSTRFGRPIEAVTVMKQRKIHRCAEYYLQCAGLIYHMPVLSFDVVEILMEGTAVVSLKHHLHCF